MPNPATSGRVAWTTARDPMNMPALDRIPVTLIGGYLGAGKTSLLNHLLTHAGGERIAVLVNDFGALGLDAALVARRDADTVTLTNGCVCCSIADDFGAALDAQVRSAAPPARIVVETSGVAEPGKTARYASGWPGVRLDAILTVVDLETIRTQTKNRFVGDLIARQIASGRPARRQQVRSGRSAAAPIDGGVACPPCAAGRAGGDESRPGRSRRRARTGTPRPGSSTGSAGRRQATR